MCEEILIRHCSPTLAGIKTANLVNMPYETYDELCIELEKFNIKFAEKGLCALALKYTSKRALVYIYRPSKLERDLSDCEAGTLLANCGYNSDNLRGHIKKLEEKIEKNGEFPHEIGLFLGYPPEDVRSFIEEKCGAEKKCKCSGAWKVYGDLENALKIFGMYEKCKRIYYSQWKCGKSIDRLIVAV
ncbi:MAG: DUF3793 family protein [Clostridiales bacterium]|jgi:hypothetical protein|nr:DUF3793 family protein [Clostridiales bacterium]